MTVTRTPQGTHPEDDYFAQEDIEKLQRLKEQGAVEAARQEAQRLKDLHWMRCAKCGTEMQPHQFRGVVIDRCGACGGVYLDAGELEKLAGEDKGGMVEAVVSFFGLKRHRQVGDASGGDAP